MKKPLNIFITITSVLLIVFLVWFFVSRDKTIPVGEAISGLLPFGSGDGLNESGITNQELGVVDNSQIFDEEGVPTSDLFRISEEPVAGAVTFARGQQTVVRHVDRATGHIYETILPTTQVLTAIQRKKITNNTLPKIYEALFRPDGGSVLLRSLRADSDTIDNVILTLTPPVSTSSDGLYRVSAANLRGEVGSVAVGPGNNLYYSLQDSNTIVTSSFSGGAVRNIMASPFTGWSLTSQGGNLIIYPKAASAVPGYAYSLNTTNGSLTRAVGPLNALIAVPDASGTWLFYSYNSVSSIKSAAKNLRTNTVVATSPATLAEKCVWSRKVGIIFCAVPINGFGPTEPDRWYRGQTSFSDRIWKFDVNQEIAEVVMEPKSSLNIDLDIVEPKLSPNDEYLIFTNKRDLSLWALRL